MKYPFDRTGSGSAPAIWALALLLIGFWLFAQLLTVLVLLPILAQTSASGLSITSGQQIWVTLISLVVASSGLAGAALWWSKRVDRRQLLDLGIRLDIVGWRQYRRGFGTGLLFALALIFLATIWGYITSNGAGDESSGQLAWRNLADPLFWLLLLGLLLAFIVQGGAEEIVCRGWLLTSITRKAGLPVGLIVSSLLFAGLHPHYFFINGFDVSGSQLLIGFVGTSAIFGMGLMLAMIAMRDRSIMGACAMHSAFNFSIIALGFTSFRLTSETQTLADNFAAAFAGSTSLSQIEPALIVQLSLSFAVAAILWVRVGLPKAQSVD